MKVLYYYKGEESMDDKKNVIIRVSPEVRLWIKGLALSLDKTIKDTILEALAEYEQNKLVSRTKKGGGIGNK
ncbi:MAG: hypothetical protein EOM04_09480 [Clostridia bacterium]|nr:hypothetical protein [Clostridia bacterium]